jgi:glycosyltransferase involved in cell wall biosynthesis
MTEETPRVSVIIPNFNYGRFLRQRLASVVGQTYTRFEIIYLDDCSTDGSEEVISEFKDDLRLRCFRNERNSGSPFIQINKGVRLSRGEFVWVAEADDFAHSQFLETLVPILYTHPSVGLVYCQSSVVDESNMTLREMDYSEYPNCTRWEQSFVTNGREECRRYLLYGCTIPNFSAALFRKSVFEKAGYADESFRLSGDWLTWIKMLMLSDLAFVAKPMNYFRWHASSVRSTTHIVRKMREMYAVFDYCRRTMPLSDQEMDIVLTKNMKTWIKTMIRERPPGWVRDTSTLFHVALQSDSKFLRRFFWYLTDSCSFGLSRRARRRLGTDILAKILGRSRHTTGVRSELPRNNWR